MVYFVSSPGVSPPTTAGTQLSLCYGSLLALPSTSIPILFIWLLKKNKRPQVKKASFGLSKFGDHLFLYSYALWGGLIFIPLLSPIVHSSHSTPSSHLSHT